LKQNCLYFTAFSSLLRKNKHVVSGGEASGQCATMKKDHVVDVVMFHPNINFEAAQILLDTTELSVGAVLRHLDKSTMSGLTQWNDLFVCKAGTTYVF